MKFDEFISNAQDAITVRKVFGEPFEKDGLTFIPAARVMGGSGGGSGLDPQGQQGEGGGFGMNARPAGAFIIRDGQIQWRPAIDPNTLIVAIATVLTTALITRAWARRRAGR